MIWDGKHKADDGKPLLDDPKGGDDFLITHWMPLPDDPNVEEYEDEGEPE